jgi:hypothetical protein
VGGFFENIAARNLSGDLPGLRPRALSRFEEPAIDRRPVSDEALETKKLQDRDVTHASEMTARSIQPRDIGPIRSETTGPRREQDSLGVIGDGLLASRISELERLFRHSVQPPPAVVERLSPVVPATPIEQRPAATNQYFTELHVHDHPQPQPIDSTSKPAVGRVINEVHVHQTHSPTRLEPERPPPGPPQMQATAAPAAMAAHPNRPAPITQRVSELTQPAQAGPIQPSQRPIGPWHEAVPRIIVERTRELGPPSSTVHVSIGRIEVRTPPVADRKPAQSTIAAPKIMSLDDYVRHRQGGMG